MRGSQSGAVYSDLRQLVFHAGEHFPQTQFFVSSDPELPFVTGQALLDACDSLACYIETAQMTGMRIPPTARVAYFRKQEKPNYWEVKRFAYELATELKKACYLL